MTYYGETSMQVRVNTDFDLPYDAEDFGMTRQDLRQKYPEGHTYYTIEEWIGLDDAHLTAYPDYWNWLMGKLEHDDLTE